LIDLFKPVKMGRVFFCNSGSEANDTQVQMLIFQGASRFYERFMTGFAGQIIHVHLNLVAVDDYNVIPYQLLKPWVGR
jgi:hypothetical protein